MAPAVAGLPALVHCKTAIYRLLQKRAASHRRPRSDSRTIMSVKPRPALLLPWSLFVRRAHGQFKLRIDRGRLLRSEKLVWS